MYASVVYCARSTPRAASSAAHARALGRGSVSSAVARLASGLKAAQSSGDERPVPRWSTSTMSRVVRTSAGVAAKSAFDDAACPGPPASTNSGSVFGDSVFAGSTTIDNVMLRSPGRARFSGTSSEPQESVCDSFDRWQSASASVRCDTCVSAQPPAANAVASSKGRQGNSRERIAADGSKQPDVPPRRAPPRHASPQWEPQAQSAVYTRTSGDALPTMTSRPLEPGIVTDLAGQLTYGEYLRLDRLLSAQEPRSTDAQGAPQHDEMLFIVQHQTSELWMKLLIHELKAAIVHIKADRLPPSVKILARVKQIQRQLFEQWAVLETLTPSEYDALRPSLASSSGFQSAQYRAIEFLLGNKNAAMLDVFRHDADVHAALQALLQAPSLYDEFIRHLARRGLPVPPECLARDVTQPHVRNSALTRAFAVIYGDPAKWWDAYDMCEKLVDVEESFQLWRFRHMKTVERIIGSKRGTGGSSGVGYLRSALDATFFPELIDVRALIGTPAPAAP